MVKTHKNALQVLNIPLELHPKSLVKAMQDKWYFHALI